MNRQSLFSYLSQATVTVLVLIVAFLVLGKVFGTMSININTDSLQRTFYVEGVGTVDKTPDVVRTEFTIQETGANQKEARDKGNAKLNQAVEMLTSLGFLKQDIKTTGFYINEDFDYTQTGRTSRGFIMTSTTSIKSKDINKINQAIDKLTELGVNIGGIQYSFDDDSTYQAEARKKAIEDAKQKAEDLAKAGGFKVGKIVSIGEYSPAPGDGYPVMAEGKGSASPATDIQPGTNQIVSRVNITYYIKD